jgi:hypothetical protein
MMFTNVIRSSGRSYNVINGTCWLPTSAKVNESLLISARIKWEVCVHNVLTGQNVFLWREHEKIQSNFLKRSRQCFYLSQVQ